MRLRGLLVGALALAALAAGLYFSNKQKSAEAAKPPAAADTSPKILTLTEADITKISLKKKGADETVLEKNSSGKWQLTAPIQNLADQDAITQLVTAAATINSDRVVEDKASDLTGFGLHSPTLEVMITTKNGQTKKLLFGDDTPTNTLAYVLLQRAQRVSTVP